MTEAEDATSRLDQVADAALRRFARYGFKRSSMEDIAREAGLAKATLYLHFKGKDDVFRAMIERFGAVVEARCREALARPLPFPETLAALMQAHFGTSYAAFGDGEHLAELKTVMTQIAARELAAFEAIFTGHAHALLGRARADGEIALGPLAAEAIVQTLVQAAIGAKMGAPPPSPELYSARLRQIAAVTAQAVAKR